jgi:hypothetical protein
MPANGRRDLVWRLKVKLQVPVVTFGKHNNEPLDSVQYWEFSAWQNHSCLLNKGCVPQGHKSSVIGSVFCTTREVTATCHWSVLLVTFVASSGSSSLSRLILGLLYPEGTLILWHIWNCWPRHTTSHLWRPEWFSAVVVWKPLILQHPFTFLSVKVWRQGALNRNIKMLLIIWSLIGTHACTLAECHQ